MWVLFGLVTHLHLAELYMRKKFKNAQNEVYASKQLALSWFRKSKAFSETVPHKSYAQVLKNSLPDKKFHTTFQIITSNTSSTSVVSPRVLKKPVSKSNYCMNPPTVTGVPVKYGKCVSAKYSVQKLPNTVLLHNRFQCLQDSYDSQDNGVHNVIHTMQSVPIHSDTSVASYAEYASSTQAKQCLQECKPPPSCSKNCIQPMLVNQTKKSIGRE